VFRVGEVEEWVEKGKNKNEEKNTVLDNRVVSHSFGEDQVAKSAVKVRRLGFDTAR
jgi:hypothetical protein